MVTAAWAGPLVIAGVIVGSIWAGAGSISTRARANPASDEMVYTPRRTDRGAGNWLTRAQHTAAPHRAQRREEERMDLVFATYGSWSHLVVRLGLGIIFFAHGAQKVLGWFGGPGLRGTVGGFKGMGIPPAATVIAALIEFLGGLAMLSGFLARPAALGLIVVMVVAIAKVHAQHGFFLNWFGTPGKGHGFEFNLALIAMALSILIGGAGALSIDRLIAPLGGD